MDIVQWFRTLNRAKFEDKLVEDDKVSVKDLLRFIEKQSELNTQLIKSVLDNNSAQSQTLANYIDLFKPRNVPSTTLDERERAKNEKVEVRSQEWEGVESIRDFNALTSGSWGMPDKDEEF